jgi:hypothetical protein
MVFVSRREDNSRMPGMGTGKAERKSAGRLVDPSAGGVLNPGAIPNWECREPIRHESVVPGFAAEESGKKRAG